MAGSVRIEAPAKLNLALSVGPAGRDRMHPICSWMVTIDLCDDVLITRREDPPLSLYGIEWHEDGSIVFTDYSLWSRTKKAPWYTFRDFDTDYYTKKTESRYERCGSNVEPVPESIPFPY